MKVSQSFRLPRVCTKKTIKTTGNRPCHPCFHGSYSDPDDLKDAIYDYLLQHNARPKPLFLSKSADNIITRERRALDAQARILSAVQDIVAQHPGGDLAIVTHGAVGTLLYCHLQGVAIDRVHDQPGQGHFWTANLASLLPDHGWRPIT
jgi:hypothetical protein